jgi:nucleotide-binding universal stress UspA family protein
MPHVEELAQKYDAKVVFVHVISPSSTIPGPDTPHIDVSEGLVKARTEEAENYLAGWKGKFREKGITARTRLEYGSVVPTIIQVAEREEADLIAMASHGRSGISRVFYGSVTSGVMQRVDRPLLLIRSRRG